MDQPQCPSQGVRSGRLRVTNAGRGDTGGPNQWNYLEASSQHRPPVGLLELGPARHDEPNPKHPLSARDKRGGARWPPRALTGPQSDTVHCRSHGGPVQFFSARGRALASHSFSSSEQRMSLVTTLRSPQRAEHCREGTRDTVSPTRAPCLRGWVFSPVF